MGSEYDGRKLGVADESPCRHRAPPWGQSPETFMGSE